MSGPTDFTTATSTVAMLTAIPVAHGLYLQPFGSVITNPTSHGRLAERLEVPEGDRDLWLLLRLGYSAEPPRSPRRPLSEVLA